MKLHPRTAIVADANLEFAKAFLALEERYDLSYGEMFGILAERMSAVAKHLRRDERHPDDPSKGGDEE